MEYNRSALRLIYVISFVDLFAVGMIFPTFSPYVKSLGCSHLQVGALSSTYAAFQVISGPIIGSWSDVRGRKSVFLITLILSTICYILLGFSTSIVTVFTFRFLLGICKQTQTLNKAIIGDLVGHNKSTISKVFGRCIAFGSIGFVVGPAIGGHLAEYPNGFQHICNFTAALFLLNIFLVLLLPNLRPTKRPGQMKSISSELQETLQDIKDVDWSFHWPSFSLKFLYIFSTTMFFQNQNAYLKIKYGFGLKESGYIVSIISVIGVIFGFLMGPFVKYFYSNDEEATLRTLHTFILLTITYLGFYLISNIYVFAFLLIPFGICNTMLRIVTMELLFNNCEDYERGCLTGVSDSMMSLGRFAAPLTSGFVTDYFDAMAVMLIASCIGGMGIVISLYTHIKWAKEKLD